MDYVGSWELIGCFSQGNVQDFEKQFKNELPSLDYETIRKNDPELNQKIEIKEDLSVAYSGVEGDLSGVIRKNGEGDILEIDKETIPIKIEKGYLIFDFEGGYVFKKSG